MTREEEIRKQADTYTDDASNYAEWSDDGGWSETNDIELIEKAYIESAKWADESFLERAYNWLNENIDLYAEVKLNAKSGYPEIQLTNDFKENFIKAMKG